MIDAPLAPRQSRALATANERVAANVRASRSPRTIAAYRSQWQQFTAYCAEHGEVELPAAPATLARYLTAADAAGKAPASLRLAIAAINRAHADKGVPSPTRDALVSATMAGISRQRGTAQKQAPRVTTRTRCRNSGNRVSAPASG